jgi:monovalent cation:H+ antiporter-2, CPA2 family
VASTVVLVRALEDRGLMASMHGRVAIGWLIVEDLATVLFLVLLPVLQHGGENNFAQEMALAFAKASVFLVIMLVFGARIVPWLLGLVARTGSRELFILAVVAGALGIASGATIFGLSIALGAFVAGVVISETEMSHQAAADVLPLREAFAVLFFVSVGMLLDPQVVRENLGLLAAVVVAVIVGKSLIAMVVAAAFPYPARTGLTVAAGLAQVGEFSFIIAHQGLDLDLIGAGTYNVILAAAVVSITLNPLAFRVIVPGERILRGTGPLWRWLDRQGPPPAMGAQVSNHVVVAGYGRVGQLTGHALAQMQLPFVVIESNLELARRLTLARINTVWGDAANSEVLQMANVGEARLLVVSVPDESTTMLAMVNAQKLNPTLPIIVRARHGGEVAELMSMGAREVVVPEYEGGLELMRQTLVALGYDAEEALHYSHAVRDIHYGDAGTRG